MDAIADFRQPLRYTSHGRPTGLAPRRVFTEPCYHGNAGALTTRFQPYLPEDGSRKTDVGGQKSDVG